MDEFVEVALEGGPASLPRTVRIERSRAREDTIKVEHHGGYEHFSRVEETTVSSENATVFRWAMRTKIAE